MQGHADREEIRVLLVQSNPADAKALQLALYEAQGTGTIAGGPLSVTRAACLSTALDRLAAESFGAVLLDLDLPDGLEALARIRRAARNTPVVAITAADDEKLALAAFQRGAQEYLVKDELEGRRLVRAIRSAIARNRSQLELLRRARELEAARTRLEQEAAELRAKAEQLDRVNHELDEFTYIASHDLKEPLRGISAYCDILLEDYHDKLDAEGRRRLEKVLELCTRLATLIDNLLTYGHVGRSRPPEGRVELEAVVEEVLDTLRPAVEQRRGSVSVVTRLPAVRADPVLIGMVFSNLISNGLKFNESPRPRVEIGALPTDPPTIYVRDNGIGIPQKHHEAIFAIFRRLHSRDKYEGTGAGLTIVRKIVETHGGKIWLVSEPDAGATFFFTLGPAVAKPSPGPPHWDQQIGAEHSARRTAEL